MKLRSLLLSLIAAFAIAAISCSKDDNDPPAPTPKTNEEILTANGWKISVIRSVIDNTKFYYKRGEAASPSTFVFDNENIIFKADKTGTYTINSGQQYTIAWDWHNADKTSIQYTIQFPTPLVVTWENMVFSEASIKYGEYYTQNGDNALSYGIRIPK